MKNFTIRYIFSSLIYFISVSCYAQFYGRIVDAQTGEPIAFATVQYLGTSIGSTSDADGNFQVPISSEFDKLQITCVGYDKCEVTVNYGRDKQNSTIKLYRNDLLLKEVVVKAKHQRYRRKGNPAVELMRRVIANKHINQITNHDYYRFTKYQRHTTSVNEVSAKTFTTGWLKKFSFLKDHTEPCAETGKLVLPLMMDETCSEVLYRHSPRSQKTIIKGRNSQGFNTIFSSGDFFTTFVRDIFTDVNIYDDNIRLLQHPFISPISSSQGIAFYHYFIHDTLMVDEERCIDVMFIPNNPQDFGFSGHIYVTNDSLVQVKRCLLNIPKYSGVNFVENLIILQDFQKLPTGERVLKNDNMIVELKYVDAITKFQVKRLTSYSDYSFNSIDDDKIFRNQSIDKIESDADRKDSAFWNNVRPLPLTETEASVGKLVNDTKALGGYKYAMLVLKALVENSIELTPEPNKIDLMPVNTFISQNYVDGLRFRLGGQTTANFNPHLFLRGYAAYGCKDNRVKYKTELEYSFKKKNYMAHEFPRHAIALTYLYDDMSPVDKFSVTDKDNVYTSVKSSKVDQMMYVRQETFKYMYETSSYFITTLQLQHSRINPAGKLVYRRVSDDMFVNHINTSDIKIGLRYAPNETFINSKQKRIPINSDAPIITLEHTVGLNDVLGADYKYNMTEVSLFKRFWLPYACGYLETYVKGGIQWNKVPFPMLFIPASNLSYFTQFDNWSFNLLRNMEFLNDRYVSLYVNWNFDGKIFNRIPFMRKLKLREYVGFKMLYGGLSDKNNPYINVNDETLFRFPARDGQTTTFIMGKTPYIEFSAGISNIFKVLTIEYVHRMNYNDLPSVVNGDKLNKNGVRFAVDIKF